MSKRTALITGAAGQDGILLTRFLTSEHDYDVCAFVRDRRGNEERLREVEAPIRVLHGDVRDKSAIESALKEIQPTEVYNLAGFSSVARSWDDVTGVLEVNSIGVANLLQTILEYREETGGEVRFYQASSSEMFGAPSTAPQTEETAFHPRSPYGVSKSAAHQLTINFRESYGLFACSGILYNHESPLRGEHFVTSKIAHAAAAIALGLQEKLVLGRLDVARDWGYAPDYVRAMWRMLQHDEAGDYIVATGVSHTLTEFIDTAFRHAGLDDWERYVTYDSRFERPAEVANLVGDATKARETLNWAPTVDFVEMVGLLVEHEVRTLQARRG